MKKQCFNPYLPSYEYIPDGEPYVFDGRVYVYGSHDRFGAMSFCENDYVTWSAPEEDLSDWRYEGIIFHRTDDPMNEDGKAPLFAPDVQKGTDGKYYLYYAPAGLNVIGVACSEKPAGLYSFCGHVKYSDNTLFGQKKEHGIVFDPGVFLDDDGQVYLYYGFTPLGVDLKGVQTGPFVVKLEGDMYTMKEDPVPVEICGCADRGHSFFEASSMRKINGKYYFIYSSLNSHELCYAIGKNSMGPFEYGGALHSNGDIGYQGRKEENRTCYTGNNHGSLVCIKGRWYIFGHRMTNYTAFSRQGVAEAVRILPDGSIPQIEMTSCGLNNGPLDGKGEYEARIACNLWSKAGARHYVGGSTGAEAEELRRDHPVFTQDGEDREECPNQHIANMHDGATAGFKYFSMPEKVTICIVTRGADGKMEVRTEPDGDVQAQILLKSGMQWQESEKVPLKIPGEKQTLYFTYCGEGVIDFMKFKLE